jgi:hypothetical protein
MSEQDPFNTPAPKSESELKSEDVEYDILYKIPASEDYPYGDFVGFVMGPNDWKYAVSFEGGEISSGRFAVAPNTPGYFPAMTKWCITANTAIDYGIEAEETPSYRQ